MGFFSSIKDWALGLRESGAAMPLREQVQGLELGNELLRERLADLELALEDADYLRMSLEGDREFSRDGLRTITKLARLMYLKNPLMNRAVSVQQFYVWAQGVSIGARNEIVNEVVKAFWEDTRNARALTGHQARMDLEADLQVEGNLFFAFFTNKSDGRVQVRTIAFDEIQEVATNPQDSKEPWFYKRTWTELLLDQSSETVDSTPRTAYYPDLAYRMSGAQRIGKIGAHPVEWDTPVHHVKTGGLSCMRFGVSEVYAALDWAKAYKGFLEDWSTITRAHARFAWNMAVPGGKNAIAAAKAKLGSTLGGSLNKPESNPPPVAGSTWISDPSVKMEPVKTAGATTTPESGRRLLLMVAAATGWPETFFGDASVGSLATAQSLDRPTELRIKNRQTLWASVFQTILGYVIFQAAAAPSGPLRGLGVVQKDDFGMHVEWGLDPETGEPIDPTVSVEFPPILERDTSKTVTAIVSAATLDGKAPAGTISRETTSKLLHTALGVQDADEAIRQAMDEEEPASPDEEPPAPPSSEDAMAEALRGFRQALDQLREASTPEADSRQ